MKKAILVTLWAGVVLAGCTPLVVKEDVPAGLSDGTFEGRAFKFPGRMIVSVTVKQGKITAIEQRRHFAPGKYRDLTNQLADTIIEKQSLKVDGITGATISSNALKKAVSDAVKKAVTPRR